MHQLHVKNRYRTGLKLDALTYDERSQDVILDKGVPIISKINNEEMGLINNQRFKIIKLDVFTITIEDDFKKFLKLIFQTFKYIFSLDMPRRHIQHRAFQLVSHTQFMSGIEWTNV
jgi:hypothetical protein